MLEQCTTEHGYLEAILWEVENKAISPSTIFLYMVRKISSCSKYLISVSPVCFPLETYRANQDKLLSKFIVLNILAHQLQPVSPLAFYCLMISWLISAQQRFIFRLLIKLWRHKWHALDYRTIRSSKIHLNKYVARRNTRAHSFVLPWCDALMLPVTSYGRLYFSPGCG